MTGLVVDTSAAVSVLAGEPAAGPVLVALDQADQRLMSSATYVELGIVLEARFGPIGGAIADRFTREGGIEVVPVDRDQAELAIGAYRRFGKGRHSASLNYGDCFTYALAESRALPVLFVGDDFAQTDLESAIIAS